MMGMMAMLAFPPLHSRAMIPALLLLQLQQDRGDTRGREVVLAGIAIIPTISHFCEVSNTRQQRARRPQSDRP
jgi:hypothetical protein